MRKGPTGQGLIGGYTEEDECSGSWFVVRRTSAVLPIWRPPLHSDLSRHLLRAAPGGALQPALWAWCPGFFIHRNVQFFISCTYTCNKKQKQKTKKTPKQTQKTSAQTVIYDKKGLLRKVWAVSLTLGRVFRERMICWHPVGGLSLTGGRRLVADWLAAGIRALKSRLFFATSLRNPDIYGC